MTEGGFATGSRRWVVTGRVQGVGYRAYAARVGRALRLKGGASNLADGGVEIWAEGPEHALERFEAALHEGPRLSRVDGLVRTEEPRTTEPWDVEF